LRRKLIFLTLVSLLLGAPPFSLSGQEDAGGPAPPVVPETADVPFPEAADGTAENGSPAAEGLSAEEPEAAPGWHRSNAAGMALERFSSRFAALRNPYALLIESAVAADLPESLKPRYEEGLFIESRTLYRDGRKERRQWIFRNGRGKTRLDAVFDESGEDAGNGTGADAPPALSPPEGAGTAPSAAGTPPSGAAVPPEVAGTAPSASGPSSRGLAGFMELYDDEGLITAEYEFSRGDADTIISYFYRRGVLVRSETRERFRGGETVSGGGGAGERHLFTDHYRYTRFGSLRAVERLYHERPDRVRLAFPRLAPGSAGKETGFVNPGLSYGTTFLEDLMIYPGYKVLYTADERGRITGETRQDEEGNTIGVLKNIWSGDHLSSVSWKTGDEERIVEFDYDEEGDRIAERDYRDGTLERALLRQGDRDVEELYLNGEVALRAVWEDGRKISEERMRRQK
jgi:YD repeat-containing protein